MPYTPPRELSPNDRKFLQSCYEMGNTEPPERFLKTRRPWLGDPASLRLQEINPGCYDIPTGAFAPVDFRSRPTVRLSTPTTSAFTAVSCVGCVGSPQLETLAALVVASLRNYRCGLLADWRARAPLGPGHWAHRAWFHFTVPSAVPFSHARCVSAKQFGG
jgi:hypothetical protein